MTGTRFAMTFLLAAPLAFVADSSANRGEVAGPSGAATRAAGETAQPAGKSSEVSAAPKPADAFAATVRPVLLARCAPCHEPGGKMYDRLPFDRAATIAEHREGVLKRLEGADRDAVAKWLATLPAD